MDDDTIIYKHIFDAIKSHNYTEVKKMLDKIGDDDIMFDINTRDSQNNYFITYAVILNQPEILKILIAKGAKIDVVDKYNRSLLVPAIMYSYMDILKILLEANNDGIGVSIHEIRDKNYRIPLHYAIEMKNIEIIELLLKYGSNPNTTDNDGVNSMHLAVKSRSYAVCELISRYISDINATYTTGENALHIACNLQLNTIANLLLENGISPNVQDHTHEITSLHYSVLLNNKELVALLLKYNANPNLQDVYGNTCLHYAIIENNFELFLMLVNSVITKNIININIWNLEGDIPLHIVLTKVNSDDIDGYLDILIEKSNLTLQDESGNTCLYYIIKLNKWKKYVDILRTKRLDIFTINTDGIMPIDILPKEDFDAFLNLLVDSYIHRLKTTKNVWHEEWENICSKSFENVTEKEKKILLIEKNKRNISSGLSVENFEHQCGNIIRDKLLDLINKVKQNNDLGCEQKSFPVKKTISCVNITEGAKITFSTFTGSSLDVLIGLLYLLNKHKNVCSTLTKNFSQNKELCSFYKSMGILMNTSCEFLNFEIVWVHQKLYLIEGFYDQIKKCMNSGRRFTIIPIGIEMKERSHAGYLIYYRQLNEVERFEPHGSASPTGLYYNPDLLDEILANRFHSIDDTIKYIKPKIFLPKIGFQILDVNEYKKKRIGDPTGFCALWCIWYVDMRLTYADINRSRLVNILIKIIKEKNISFKNLIRNYGQHIINIRDKILKKSDMDINDWLNDQYNDIQINTMMASLVNEINNVNKNK